MKTKITIITLLLMAVVVTARVLSPFFGWNHLEAESPDIIVADPGNPTPPPESVNGPRYDFSISVLSVLKGTNNVRHASLQTDHELRPRQAYLVFGSYGNGIYKAYEEYRVVPLGTKYTQDMIAGKSLDEQIQILFQLAIDNLNDEITKKETEKQQLEQGIQK